MILVFSFLFCSSLKFLYRGKILRFNICLIFQKRRQQKNEIKFGTVVRKDGNYLAF